MSQTKAQLVGGVGISTAQNVVVGSAVTINSTGIDVTGIVTATSFSGDGSNLTNTGSTLSAASGSQRVVVTTQTSGTMTASATDGDLTYDANSDTLNTANLHVTGISTLGTTNGIGKVTIGIGTTALLVEGNARVTGILTVGSSSITLDGGSDSITVGSGATITGSGNVNVSGTITGSTGCIRGTFTGSTVCATTGFSGDGASLTNLTAANIPGLPALIPSGATVCEYSVSGTWTKPPSVSAVYVELWGAGGGGSGGNYNTCINTEYSGGTGGGGGAYKYKLIPGSSIPGPISITIGSGGAGGSKCSAVEPGPFGFCSGQASPGSSGGDTTFGSLLSAAGGAGGMGCPNSCPTYSGCIFNRGGGWFPNRCGPPFGPGCTFLDFASGTFYGSCNNSSIYGGASANFGSIFGGSGGGSGGSAGNCAANGNCYCSPGAAGGTPDTWSGGGGSAGCPGCPTSTFGAGGGGGGRSGFPGIGYPGGNGGPGGGGGGGGAGMWGPDGGNGGSGGDGYARVVSW